MKKHNKPPKSNQLPSELIDVILDFYKANNSDHLSGIAVVARANRQMYNVAIEKLYETITMTEWNEERIGYGTLKPVYSDDGELQKGNCRSELTEQKPRYPRDPLEKTLPLSLLGRSYLTALPKSRFPDPLD